MPTNAMHRNCEFKIMECWSASANFGEQVNGSSGPDEMACLTGYLLA